jgi:hypothetical protein
VKNGACPLRTSRNAGLLRNSDGSVQGVLIFSQPCGGETTLSESFPLFGGEWIVFYYFLTLSAWIRTIVRLLLARGRCANSNFGTNFGRVAQEEAVRG